MIILSDNYAASGAVREYQVQPCNRSEIAEFVERWHYSKNVNGLTIKYCFKLLDCENNVIGAMIFGGIAMANVWN